MKKILFLYLPFLCILLISCDKDSAGTQTLPETPPMGDSNAGCNISLVKVERIAAEDVTEDKKFGDYFFTLKSLKTTKKNISVKGLYVKNGVAVKTIIVATNAEVGIDETVTLKITTEDIKNDNDFDCMEYFIIVESLGTEESCELIATDC